LYHSPLKCNIVLKLHLPPIFMNALLNETQSSLRKEIEAFIVTLEAGKPPAGDADDDLEDLSSDPEIARHRADEIAALETARFLAFRAACLEGHGAAAAEAVRSETPAAEIPECLAAAEKPRRKGVRS
jgi:endonuclease V-like protein UPF0215 family